MKHQPKRQSCQGDARRRPNPSKDRRRQRATQVLPFPTRIPRIGHLSFLYVLINDYVIEQQALSMLTDEATSLQGKSVDEISQELWADVTKAVLQNDEWSVFALKLRASVILLFGEKSGLWAYLTESEIMHICEAYANYTPVSDTILDNLEAVNHLGILYELYEVDLRPFLPQEQVERVTKQLDMSRQRVIKKCTLMYESCKHNDRLTGELHLTIGLASTHACT